MKRLIIVICWLVPLCGYAQLEEQESSDKIVSEKVRGVKQVLTDSIKSIYAASLRELRESAQDSIVQVRIAELQQAFEIELVTVLEEALTNVEEKYLEVLEAVEDCKHKAEKERLKAEEKKKKEEAKKQKEAARNKKDFSEEEKQTEKPEASLKPEKKEEKQEDVSDYTENYWNKQEGLLRGDSLFTNVKALVDGLVNADDSLHHYYAIIHDLDSLGGRISKLDTCIGGKLKGFVKDVNAVKNAEETLNTPYNKAKKDAALGGLNSLSFLNKAQVEICSVDSLKEALRYYYLTTSNMLDFIQEVQDAHAMYTKEGASEQDKENAQASLRESFSIEARIDNFRMVAYMNGLYKEILDIVLQDENGNYRFESFDMNRLESIKQELEKDRKSN